MFPLEVQRFSISRMELLIVSLGIHRTVASHMKRSMAPYEICQTFRHLTELSAVLPGIYRTFSSRIQWLMVTCEISPTFAHVTKPSAAPCEMHRTFTTLTKLSMVSYRMCQTSGLLMEPLKVWDATNGTSKYHMELSSGFVRKIRNYSKSTELKKRENKSYATIFLASNLKSFGLKVRNF